MRQILCSFALLSVVAWSGDGRPPRANSADYSVHEDMKTATIAAVRVASEQLNKNLPSDLAKKYVVLEVAIYPKGDAVVEISALDFSLKLGTDGESHPETAEEVASMWRPHSAHPDVPSKAHVNTEAGIIVAHGQDPVTGRPANRVGTYERVGVSNDPRQPMPNSSSSVDADRFEAMLGKWALPEGKTASPVAGYLYFPLPLKKTKGAFELQYTHDGSSANLTLPAPSK
jgi:hypothetical protein